MKSFVRCWLIAVLIAAQPAAVWASNCRAVSFRHNVVQKVIVKEVVAAVVVPVVAKLVAVEIPIYNTQFVAPYTAPYTSSYAPPQAPAYVPPPAYSAPYSHPVAPVGAAPCPDHTPTFRQIASLLQVLDARLAKIEGVPPAGPPTMPPADPNGTGEQPVPPVPPPLKPTNPFDPMGQPPPAQPAAQSADRLLALATTHCSACHDKSRAQASGKGFVLLEGGKFSASLTPDSLGLMIDNLASRKMPKGGNMPDVERLEMIQLLVAGPSK